MQHVCTVKYLSVAELLLVILFLFFCHLISSRAVGRALASALSISSMGGWAWLLA